MRVRKEVITCDICGKSIDCVDADIWKSDLTGWVEITMITVVGVSPVAIKADVCSYDCMSKYAKREQAKEPELATEEKHKKTSGRHFVTEEEAVRGIRIPEVI